MIGRLATTIPNCKLLFIADKVIGRVYGEGGDPDNFSPR